MAMSKPTPGGSRHELDIRTYLYTPREASSTGVVLSILMASVEPRDDTAWPRSLAPEAMKALHVEDAWVGRMCGMDVLDTCA